MSVNHDLLKEMIYKRMQSEQQTLLRFVLDMDVETVLEYAFLITIRNMILIVFKEIDLSDEELEVLAKCRYPLSEIYGSLDKIENNLDMDIVMAIKERAKNCEQNSSLRVH